MKYTLVSLFIFFYTASLAQQYDANWIFGFNGAGAGLGPWDRELVHFNPSLSQSIFSTHMNFSSTNVTMSDELGNLIFFSNGAYIADRSGDTMMNGGGLNPGTFCNNYGPGGLPIMQGMISLPCPGNSNVYYIIHMTGGCPASQTCQPLELMYSRIDMSLNGGLGAVVEKNVVLFHDTLTSGQLCACKHGNGTDWWIFVPEQNTNVYHRILLSPTGFQHDTVSCGTPHPGTGWNGKGVFSPDGNWFCRYDQTNGMSIMQFDRCSGLFSNELFRSSIFFPDNGGNAGGAEFSPSSQLLYITSGLEINQFDLTSTNIVNSQTTVAVVDTFGCPFPSNFYYPQLAPDGRIYICSGFGIECLTYINKPDVQGLGCDVVKHGLSFPLSNAFTMPSNPEYRLGAASCWINISSPSLEHFTVYPDPATDKIIFDFGIENKYDYALRVYSSDGRLIYNKQLKVQSSLVNLNGYDKGIYFYNIQCDDGSDLTGKFIVQ